MTCVLCEQEVRNNENQVNIETVNMHLCCWLKGVAGELENNSLAFEIVGQKLSVKESFQKTVPITCEHSIK